MQIKLQVQIDAPLNDIVRVMHPTLGLVVVYVVYERIG